LGCYVSHDCSTPRCASRPRSGIRFEGSRCLFFLDTGPKDRCAQFPSSLLSYPPSRRASSGWAHATYEPLVPVPPIPENCPNLLERLCGEYERPSFRATSTNRRSPIFTFRFGRTTASRRQELGRRRSCWQQTSRHSSCRSRQALQRHAESVAGWQEFHHRHA
jgi:hypothetical protein